MATYIVSANPCSRRRLISRLREVWMFPSHNISSGRKSGNFGDQNCFKCSARAFIQTSRPKSLFSRFATGVNVRPNTNGPNVRPNVSPSCRAYSNFNHRLYCGLGIKKSASTNVHSPLKGIIFNNIYTHAQRFQTQRCQPQRNVLEIRKCNSESEGSRNHVKSTRSGFCIASSAAFLFFNFKKEEEEDTIEFCVAKAVSAEKKGQMGDAANFYHQAVTLAQQENKKDKVAFIYDMMANFYLRIDEKFKAEKLFKETIKLLLESGFEQHDPAVLEISLKLASMYELQFRYTEAEAGYRFCISKSEEGLESYKKSEEKDFDKEMNLYAMLGVSLDAYGKFMLKQHHLDEAEKAYLRAIRICENELADKGKPHPQTATLLNDLGTVYEQKKNYSKAMETICKAEKLAKDSKDDLAIIMCNKASLHLKNGNREDATSLFRQALRLAERSQDEETIRFVRIAMSKLAAPLRKDS